MEEGEFGSEYVILTLKGHLIAYFQGLYKKCLSIYHLWTQPHKDRFFNIIWPHRVSIERATYMSNKDEVCGNFFFTVMCK